MAWAAPRATAHAFRAPCSSAAGFAASAAARRAAAPAGRAFASKGGPATAEAVEAAQATPGVMGAIVAFQKTYPFANNIIIATCKTSAADLLTQVAVEKKSFDEIDWQRNLSFVVFGAAYLGGFQWLIQVNIFSKLFPNMLRFTEASWATKLKDTRGQIDMAKQVFLDAIIHLPLIYLPTFYCVKEMVQGGKSDPVAWVQDGCSKYVANWWTDVPQLVYVWVPTDIVCFSAPLWLRMPVRHVVSFVWTAYLSFLRG